MDAVEGVNPVGKFSELAGLFETGQVHQQFQPRALMGPLTPRILQRLSGVLT